MNVDGLLRKPGVYVITNSVTYNIYIGSSNCVRGRILSHISSLNRGAHKNQHLQRSWDRYGQDAFVVSVFAYTDPDNAVKYEQLLLDTLNPGYNIHKQAIAPDRASRIKMSVSRTGVLGSRHTERSRKLLSEKLKGHPVSEEARKKMSAASKGRKLSEATKLKLSKALTGRRHSEESRKKMSAAQVNRQVTEETREKLRRANKGKTLSDETKEKISRAGKGRRQSDATRDKIRDTRIKRGCGVGLKQSQETRSKRSESMKKTLEKKRSLAQNVDKEDMD